MLAPEYQAGDGNKWLCQTGPAAVAHPLEQPARHRSEFRLAPSSVSKPAQRAGGPPGEPHRGCTSSCSTAIFSTASRAKAGLGTRAARESRPAAEGAAPFYEGLERLGARTPDLALIALRLVLAGKKADDASVTRLRDLVARVHAGDPAARDEYRAIVRPGSLVLSIADLVAHYAGDARRALDRVSFDVPDGATLAIVGPSGAGKTTLLRAISGLLPVQRRRRASRRRVAARAAAAAATRCRRGARRCALYQHERRRRICASRLRHCRACRRTHRSDGRSVARCAASRAAPAPALGRRAAARLDCAGAALRSGSSAARRTARASRSVAAPCGARRNRRRPSALCRSDSLRHARSRGGDECRRLARRADGRTNRRRRRAPARLRCAAFGNGRAFLGRASDESFR